MFRRICLRRWHFSGFKAALSQGHPYQDKDDDRSQTSSSQFLGTITGNKGPKKIIHNADFLHNCFKTLCHEPRGETDAAVKKSASSGRRI
jgi:hypothetical protein